MAFLEVAKFMYSLRDLSRESSLNFNIADPNAINILIGCHLIDIKLKILTL